MVLSQNGSKKSGVIGYSGDAFLNEVQTQPTHDGASLDPRERDFEGKPTNFTGFGRNHSFQAISEE